ncbi:MAG: site-specific integrase [Myxococcales bacterium]|nr:site-specific integrase [Myxococcales bacterium]
MARVKGEATRYPGIEKVETARFGRGYGYRARADAREAGGGQPEQTFATMGEARDWQAEVESQVAQGTYVGKSPVTVERAVTDWLDGQRGATNTREGRNFALGPVVTALGDRRVQSITKRDVERCLDLLVAGEIEGWVARSPGYTNRTRAMWSACWDDLVAQGTLPRNVVALVKPLSVAEPDPCDDDDTAGSGSGDAIDERRRLSDAEITALLDAHRPLPRTEVAALRGHEKRAYRSRQRRATFIELALMGLRRGELAGLRWSALDLDAEPPVLRVVATRVPVAGGVEEKRRGKTRSASRVLVLPPATVTALRRHRTAQAEDEKRSGGKWCGDTDLAVLTKDNGRAVSPSTLDTWWHDAMGLAGVSGYRLHDMRHTCASRLLSSGVPILAVASWLGHADGGTLALRVYGHADLDDLGRAAQALAHP